MKIKINNTTFFFFNNFSVKLTLGAVASSFSFVARFNPDNLNHRMLFKPLSYPKIEIFTDEDVLLLTGIIINHDFNSDKNPQLVKVSGYSNGGILEDVTIPFSLYPLESIRRSLKDITERLLKRFNLKLIVDSSVSEEVNSIYEKTVAQPTESIKNYLSKLASQKNVVLSHNNKGDIVFFRPNTKALPKVFFNKENTTNITLSIKGQAIHSEITVLRQLSKENNKLSPVDTIENSLITAFRPLTKTLTSGTDTSTKLAADNILAKELRNIQIGIKIPKWEELSPGDLIDVQDNEIFLFEKTKLIIDSLVFNENQESKTMTIIALLPESYTGEAPKNIFL